MTRFTVIWPRSVQVDPLSKGMEVSEGLRALFAPPLRILYSVREEDRIVEVLRVRRI